eukprot:gnl/Dysnectes_brevis/8080_a14154_164.p1 GENE.gnl/Dysnectes_brevis/8080_a14154_164~~gnl/Dysnectes_brevis/8080_a14154_164.p1  ORF type:complete len:319 (-),score=37.90 gnl/Dysnectes_brevis/8080_a14154_164:844-1800(-)
MPSEYDDGDQHTRPRSQGFANQSYRFASRHPNRGMPGPGAYMPLFQQTTNYMRPSASFLSQPRPSQPNDSLLSPPLSSYSQGSRPDSRFTRSEFRKRNPQVPGPGSYAIRSFVDEARTKARQKQRSRRSALHRTHAVWNHRICRGTDLSYSRALLGRPQPPEMERLTVRRRGKAPPVPVSSKPGVLLARPRSHTVRGQRAFNSGRHRSAMDLIPQSSKSGVRARSRPKPPRGKLVSLPVRTIARAPQHRLPGPGSYDPVPQDPETLRRGHNAVFRSAVNRFELPRMALSTPGATYSVPRRLTDRQSFHLNEVQRWINR